MTQSARERILKVAGELFFKHGYRAVGIDTIIAESDVAKATLYRHFPSKDDLIVTYLQEMNDEFWKWFDNAAEQYPDDPRQQLLSVFQSLQQLVTTPTCYGCPFIIAVGEFPEIDHPAHQIARANKESVHARLLQMCQKLDIDVPQHLADQLFLLMDGAFAAVRMFGIQNPASQIDRLATHMIDSYLNYPT